MSAYKTGDVLKFRFTTQSATGGAVAADVLPTAILSLNGVNNGAAVTVTDLTGGQYLASVTVPAVVAGDQLGLIVLASVASISGVAAFGPWLCDTRNADMNNLAAGAAMTLTEAYDAAKTAAQAGDEMTISADYDPAKTAAQAGDEMALTGATVTSLASAIATAVWSAGTRTLTAMGDVAASIWEYAERTLTSMESVAAEVWDYPTRAITSIGAVLEEIDSLLSSNHGSGLWTKSSDGGNLLPVTEPDGGSGIMGAYLTDIIVWIIDMGVDEWGTPNEPEEQNIRARVVNKSKLMRNFSGEEEMATGYVLTIQQPSQKDKFKINGTDHAIIAINEKRSWGVNHYESYIS